MFKLESDKLNRVFDYFGPSGIIPNGLNYNFLDSYILNDFQQGKSIEHFIKKYEQVATYDCNHNIPADVCNDISVKDFSLLNSNEHTTFYPITPFGSVLCGLGEDFTFHENATFFDFISKTAKQQIIDKNLHILFDYSSEGDIREVVFERIHEGLKKHDIPADRLVFVCSAVNTHDIYSNWLQENPQEVKIKTAVYPWAVYAKSRELKQILESGNFEFKGGTSTYASTDSIDFDSKRTHKFLCLNRRLKPHRIILLALLENHGLVKDNLVSYDINMLYCNDAQIPFQVDLQQQQYTSDKEQIKDILKGYHTLRKRKKQVVDNDDIHSVWGFGYENASDYQNTYFSIVSETLFYEFATYISEKTFKPFAHCHPFVMVSKQGTLKYLKEIGFKTFGDFWDESYDDEEDNEIRMKKIAKLVKELAEKTDEEWLELYKKMKPVLLYNREKLLEFGNNTDGLAKNYLIKLKKLVHGDYQENYSLL